MQPASTLNQSINPTHPSVPRHKILMIAGLLLTAAIAPAQNTPVVASDKPADSAETQSPDKEKAVVVLNPFRVNAGADNDGYRSSETNTGVKIATPLKDIPLTINVLTADFLKDVNLRSVMDAVKYVPGVNQQAAHENDGERFFIRGFSTLSELRNGAFYNASTDSVNIDRIEVAKGPSTILYGNTDPGGVVNYVTKVPYDKASSMMRLIFGSFQYHRLELDLNQPLTDTNKLLFRIPLSLTDNHTEAKFVHQRTTFLNPVVIWNISPRTSVTLDFTYRRQEGAQNRDEMPQLNGSVDSAGNTIFPDLYAVQIPGLGYEYQSASPSDFGVDEHSYKEIRLNHTINEFFSLELRAGEDRLNFTESSGFHSATRNAGFETVKYPNPANLTFNSLNFIESVRWKNYNYELNLYAKQEFGGTKNQLVLGVQGTKGTGFIFNFKSEPTATFTRAVPLQSPDTVRYNRGDFSQYVLWFGNTEPITTQEWGKPSFYLTDQLSAVNDHLHVLGGVRRQFLADVKVTKTVPQIGVIYDFSGLSPYASWSSSYQSNGVNAINPSIVRPMQKATDYDIGVKLNLFEGKLTGSICYFNLKKENIAISDYSKLINTTTGTVNTGGDTVYIAGAAESKGVEFDLQYSPSKNLQIVWSYSHDDAKDTFDVPARQGSRLPGADTDAMTLWAKYHFDTGPLTGLDLGGGGRFVFGGTDYTAPDNPAYFRSRQVEDYEDLSVFANYPIKMGNRSVIVGVSVNNITSKRYLNGEGFSSPRTYYVNAEYKF